MSSNSRPVPSSWWRHPYCYYCGKRVFKSHPGSKKLPKNTGTIEHIPPRWIAKLGDGLPMTRVLACHRCNSRENKRVQELFPRFFFVLWNERRIAEPRRKMLPPGSQENQDHQQYPDPPAQDLPLPGDVVGDDPEGDGEEAPEESEPVHVRILSYPL